ncbi:hypothetical protein NL676_010919 [Syzygium grande]|nr:hypothetical protein NL676_010919 [Syzygium grande]
MSSSSSSSSPSISESSSSWNTQRDSVESMDPMPTTASPSPIRRPQPYPIVVRVVSISLCVCGFPPPRATRRVGCRARARENHAGLGQQQQSLLSSLLAVAPGGCGRGAAGAGLKSAPRALAGVVLDREPARERNPHPQNGGAAPRRHAARTLGDYVGDWAARKAGRRGPVPVLPFIPRRHQENDS